MNIDMSPHARAAFRSLMRDTSPDDLTRADAQSTLIREGQYVRGVPLVVKGLVKVFARYEERDLLLYYIREGEGCVMSFAAALYQSPSKVYAVAETDCELYLLPAERLPKLLKTDASLNELFFELYNKRYTELLDTVQHVLFDKMDKRLLDYLREKIQLTGKNPLHMSHREIANELGTVREVISRVMKRLEYEGKVKQHASSVELPER
ncbi:MAG: Crp/Fnr family transcriptional regulator [Flavobacteriales bacterium]|nr:Crp/Fnr family transcriptional regulator [Flavobacteriales bacterium]